MRWARPCLVLAALLLVAAAQPNDPLISRSYHLEKVRAYEAWDVSRGDSITVAVVDTGIDGQHPDLRGQLVPGVDLVDHDETPGDANGHGTLVAGVLAAVADNRRGVAGVAPHVDLMPVRVLDAQGKGDSETVADGIRWAVDHGADVVNLSLADVPGQTRSSPASLITDQVELAIREAWLRGVVVVAAAGNEGKDETPYRDDLPLIVVGASDRQDRVWRDSNRDDETLFAPGVEIPSTWKGGYALADGTSFATPIVSAGAALLLAAGYEPGDARERLLETARPIGAGHGRVDVAAALGLPPPRQPEPQEPEPTPRDDEGTAGDVGGGDGGTSGSPDGTGPPGADAPDDSKAGTRDAADGRRGDVRQERDGRDRGRDPAVEALPEAAGARDASQDADVAPATTPRATPSRAAPAPSERVSEVAVGPPQIPLKPAPRGEGSAWPLIGGGIALAVLGASLAGWAKSRSEAMPR